MGDFWLKGFSLTNVNSQLDSLFTLDNLVKSSYVKFDRLTSVTSPYS